MTAERIVAARAAIAEAPRARTRTVAGYGLVALGAASWGTWPLILRPAEAIATMPPALESLVVMLVLVVVSGVLMTKDRVPRAATRREWLEVGWLGLSDAFNVLLFFAAYQVTGVAIAVLTHYLAPILVALAAPFVVRERQGVRTYVALALSFAGLVLLLAPWREGSRPGDTLGAFLGAGSAVFYASNVLVTKRLAGAFSGSELTFFHGLVSLVVLALFVPREAWGHLDARALALVLAGGLGPGAMGGLFFVWGLRRIPASHASTLTLLEPLVAVLLAAWVFHERLDAGAVVGAASIVIGAGLVVSKPQS